MRKDIMKRNGGCTNSGYTLTELLVIVFFLFGVVALGWLGYVAYHFIMKHW